MGARALGVLIQGPSYSQSTARLQEFIMCKHDYVSKHPGFLNVNS